MTASQKRAHADELLKANPARSDRSIAEEAKMDRETVSRDRKQLEATGGRLQLKKRVGADGKARQQPAKRAKRTPTISSLTSKQNPTSAGSSQAAERKLPADLIRSSRSMATPA